MSWPTVRLDEIAKIDRRGIDPSAIEAGTKYIGLEHIASGGEILNADCVNCGQLASTKFLFRESHVLYGKLRPYLAKIALPNFSGICSTDILPIQPGPDLDRRFLAYFLRQPHLVEMASARSTGVNLPRLSPKTLAEFEVPFPPLAEQRRIVAILDKAHGIRRKRERALEMVNDLLVSTFWERFFQPGEGWPIKPLRSISELINGDRSSNYPSGKEIVDEGVLFLSTKNILGSNIIFSDRAFITQEKFHSLSRGKLRRGDLVMTLRGSIGQCAVFDCEYETGFINAQLMIVRPGPQVTSGYLHRLLIHPSIQHKLLMTKSGSAVPQLTAKKIGDLEIPVPPIEAQKDFDDVLRRIQSVNQDSQEAAKDAERLFASLCQRAFRGEL